MTDICLLISSLKIRIYESRYIEILIDFSVYQVCYIRQQPANVFKSYLHTPACQTKGGMVEMHLQIIWGYMVK